MATAWNEHDLLVYIMSTIQHGNIKLDCMNAPPLPGKSASACAQKINGLKKTLKAEIDAIHAGQPIGNGGAVAAPAAKKTGGGRKRKTPEENGDDEAPKKRGRGRPKAKKSEEVVEKDDDSDGVPVKDEVVEEEDGIGDDNGSGSDD